MTKEAKNKLSKHIPQTKDEELQEHIERRKKKETKWANKTGYISKFFNETDVENLREKLEQKLNRIADKYDVRHLDVVTIEAVQTKFGDDFQARDWSWNENFFKKYLLQVEDLKGSQYQSLFQPWWLDQLILQISVMIWNLVNKTVKQTWRKTGTYPGAENLSRKIRNSGEGVATHFADLEVNEFEREFK